MSLRRLYRSQLIDEGLIIILATQVADPRVRLLAGVTAIALLLTHRRELILTAAGATLAAVGVGPVSSSAPAPPEDEPLRLLQK